jgi:SsrA-binding protein
VRRSTAVDGSVAQLVSKQRKKPVRPSDGHQVIATNRTARRDFDILDTYEAGIVLRGTEVKALREGQVQFADANVWVDGGEAYAMGIHIQPWGSTVRFGDPLEPARRRKLLLHKQEIDALDRKAGVERLALVPISLYFKDGRVKVEVAVARGRRKEDKRQVLATRDAERDIARALARRQSGKASTD